VILGWVLFAARPVAAQEPPAPIGPWVVDVHGTVPNFPDSQQLADSRSLALGELPGRGLGLHFGAHVYPLRWKIVTFGIGADVTLTRAHQSPEVISGGTSGRPVTEQFAQASPQLSFNFGKGSGWSYISGGIGPGQWSVIVDGQDATDVDVARLPVINYGGGARWFIKHHLAFSFDVRFYAINPPASLHLQDLPNPPRTHLLIMGAGISVR
jgi:hypothetical protein